jgi:hypothetical protein
MAKVGAVACGDWLAEKWSADEVDGGWAGDDGARMSAMEKDVCRAMILRLRGMANRKREE